MDYLIRHLGRVRRQSRLRRPIDAARAVLARASLRIFPAALVPFLSSGCGAYLASFTCTDVPYGYNVEATLQDESSEPLRDVRVFMRMKDEDGFSKLRDSRSDQFRTNEEGVVQAQMRDYYQRCLGGLFLDPALDPPPAPLPDPAFVELLLPFTEQTVTIAVNESMVSRNPGEPFDDLDLGVVTIPSE